MDSKKLISAVDYFIIFVYFYFLIIFESINALFELFSYGIFKSEILTEKSDLGFDLKIKIK